MGALCCCSRGDEFEEYGYPSNSVYRHCVCLRFFLHQLFCGYGTMFHRIEGRPISTSVQGTTPLASSGIGTAFSDNTLSETRLLVTRPVPYNNTEQRSYTRLQRDGLVSRRDKSATHFQEDSQQLRRNMSSSAVESLSLGKKWTGGGDSEDDGKIGLLEASEKAFSEKSAFGVQSTSEDEDVCPTCLDEYTPENPKITTKCSHHFHLGCIYEWLERSDSCPICGKEMEFCETP